MNQDTHPAADAADDLRKAALEEAGFREVAPTPPSLMATHAMSVLDKFPASRFDAAEKARHAAEPGPAPVPLLLEASLEGNLVEVTMPDGERWKYTLGDTCAALCTVLVAIEPATPKTCQVFRPGCEGIHPWIGTAERFGVERRAS